MMKRKMTLLAAMLVGMSGHSLQAGYTPESILKAFEKVSRIELAPQPDYPVYDPFERVEPVIAKAKPVAPKPAPTLPRLAAIVNGKAFLDGRWVAVGDDLGPFRVLKITDDLVLLREENGKTHKLSMRPSAKLFELYTNPSEGGR